MRINIAKGVRFLKDHSGTICAFGAVVGVAVTAYLSGKAAVKTYTDLDPDTDKKLKAKVITKNYLKTAVSFAITVGLIVESDHIHRGQKAALAGLALMWKDKFITLDKKVTEVCGEEKAKEIRDEIVKDKIKQTPFTGTVPEGKKLYFEPYTEQYIVTDDYALQNAYYMANKKLTNEFECSLNYIIGLLGGDTKKIDDKYGWYYDSEIQSDAWSYYGGPWIEPRKDVYMYPKEKQKDQAGPMRFLRLDETPTNTDIPCLFYWVDPVMYDEDDMLWKD